MKPTISVVVPTYNRAHLIGEALNSILAQTIQPHEIIVVDDGSTDGSGAIVAQFPGVRYIRQANAGPAAARNNGIRSATGNLIAFWDSDDLCPPNRFEVQLGLLKKHPDLDFIFGNEATFSAGNPLVPVKFDHGQPTGPIANPFPLIVGGINVPTSSVLIRREVAVTLNGMDESLRMGEDFDLWIRVALHGYRIGIVAIPLSHRRFHAGNLVNEKLKLKEAVCTVLMRYHHAGGVAVHWITSAMNYDLGSHYFKTREWTKAKVHLAKVTHVTAKRRCVLLAKRAVLAFV